MAKRTPKIQLLYFPGCPNVAETRRALAAAVEQLALDPDAIEAVNVHGRDCPDHLRNWPSPSILIDGRDIEGTSALGAAACRIYPGGRAPAAETIVNALKAALKTKGDTP